MSGQLRSIEQDLLVITKDNVNTYCYKHNLARYSSVFDSLFSSNMLETSSNDGIVTLRLNDVNKATWDMFYSFVCPQNPFNMPQLNEPLVEQLLPLFHQYQIKHCIDACDSLLNAVVLTCSTESMLVSVANISAGFWGSDSNNNETRKDNFISILHSFRLASVYNLSSTLPAAAAAVSGLLSYLEHTGDLFTPHEVFALIDALNPFFPTDGEVQQDDPREGTRIILKQLLHEDYDLEKFKKCDDDETSLVLFSHTIHAMIQREAAEKKLHLVHANAHGIIRSAGEMFPRQLFDIIHNIMSNQVHLTAIRRGLVELFYEHQTDVRRKEYTTLGIDAPSADADAELARDAILCFIKENRRE